MTTIVHITTQAAWTEAEAAGVYRGDTLATEGFIHCSRPDQVAAVAAARFAGRTDLVLLTIDRAAVGARIVDENLEGGSDPFPHIYGALEMEAVVRVDRFREVSGRFVLPGHLG